MGQVIKKKFRVRCPSCFFVYTLVVYGKAAIWTTCPDCNYSDYFSNFPHEEVENGDNTQRK